MLAMGFSVKVEAPPTDSLNHSSALARAVRMQEELHTGY
jgi:hypothetical protein